ncbi:MAG: hypothetical protein ACKO5K_12140, partial [Armatimonadota bacterium]
MTRALLVPLALWCLSGSLASSPAWADPPRRIKLVVWGLQSGKETAGLDAQIAEFERQNPDVDVSALSIGA